MSFSKWEGKQEIRFGQGGNKKFMPDPGKYEVEIQDTMDTVYNEKSGITSLIIDFKTVGYPTGTTGDADNLNLNVKVWFPDGIKVAKDKLSAVIYSAGMARQFDELFEDVPDMSDEKWVPFLREVRDRLSFRKIGIEVAHRKGKKNDFPDVVSFFPVQQPKKAVVETDDNFAWPEQQ